MRKPASSCRLDVKDPNAARPVVDVARAVGASALERLWLCSGDQEELARWRAFCGPAALVLSTRTEAMTDGAAAQATALTAAGIDAVNLRGREWSEPLVATFHRQGLLAFGWDAQSDSMLARLLALDIDAVYCDDVGRMPGHCGRTPDEVIRTRDRSTRGHNRRVKKARQRKPRADSGQTRTKARPTIRSLRDEADKAGVLGVTPVVPHDEVSPLGTWVRGSS